jgi:hypothetical protein
LLCPGAKPFIPGGDCCSDCCWYAQVIPYGWDSCCHRQAFDNFDDDIDGSFFVNFVPNGCPECSELMKKEEKKEEKEYSGSSEVKTGFKIRPE